MPDPVADVAFRALYSPRSMAGKYQWDPLMFLILYIISVAKEQEGTNNISFIRFITTFSKEFAHKADEDPGVITGKLSYQFQRVADRLAYLETHQPTNSDFAVDALQEAFCGLIHSYHGGVKRAFQPKEK